MTDIDDLWNRCTGTLREQVPDATWRTWLAQLRPLRREADTLVVAVPSTLVRDRVEHRFLDLVASALADAAGTPLSVRLEVRTSDRTPADVSVLPGFGMVDEDSSARGAPARHTMPTDAAVRGSAPVDPSRRAEALHLDLAAAPHGATTSVPSQPGAVSRETAAPGLDQRFTFDSFVIGSSNRFAHAAALSVAEAPARSYNPLFVYGGAGLGKTHLLHAIGNYVAENFLGRRVRYVSTETFMNEFVAALRTSAAGSFKSRYRDCDVLLIDDVQFIEGKESLQEELFHTFNHLSAASKQIVLTSDRPPRSIATLEDRLRSRFMSGLITDVQPPELETRMAILQKKAEREMVTIPDDVLAFIATHVKDNIRELEGAFIRVTAYGSLNGQAVTLDLAEHVLSDIVAARQPRMITPKVILDSTAEAFGFTVEDLCGPSRRRPLVIARQIGMYVFRELTDFSYPAIAREFGGRDHTTVMHAVDKISALMKERRQIFEQVTELILRIKNGE